MDKQTTLAFILIGLILMVWIYMTAPTPEAPKETVPDTTVTTPAFQEKEENKQDPAEVTKLVESTEEEINGKFFSAKKEIERIITIENDLAVIELSSKGGVIKKYFLKEYNNWYASRLDETAPFYQRNVQLIYDNHGGEFDIVFITTDGKKINTSKLFFDVNLNKHHYKLSGNDSLSISFTVNAGNEGSLSRKYVFYGDRYDSRVDLEFNKMHNVISQNRYDVVWTNGIKFVEENSVDEANFSNASAYMGGEQVIFEAGDKQRDLSGSINWIAVRNKYFASIIAPLNPADVEGAYFDGYNEGIINNGVREYYTAGFIVPFKNTNLETKSFTLYVGPISYRLLKEYNNNYEAIVDFGGFFGLKFIIRPISEFVLLPLFNFLHGLIPNYGVVIIVFALIIKIAVYPLTKTSFKSMKKMQLLQPKMTEIREKFKDDPQKVNKEMMKLYSTYGINPMGGCFPLLLQMPIFIALWGLFQAAIELRQQPFISYITDLSRPDILVNLYPFEFMGISHISGLAVLMGVTTFIQQKMTIKDPKQKAMVYVMPPMLTLLFMSFPSGLNLYYFMFNLFSIAQQQWIVMKKDETELVPVKNPKKSGGFMQRMMEAAEQKAKTQQKKK